MPPIEAVLIGAGQRGRYASGAFALRRPEELKFVAVAEPSEARRALFAEFHGIPPERQFASWEDMLAQPRLAPLCFNTTMDRMHLTSSLAAFDKGYHLLLEKPMSDTPEGCLRIAEAAKEKGLMVQICHPLRYTPFYLKVKETLDSGAIGEIISVSMQENVAYWHFAHSYVRGNWHRKSTSGPMILTKCCHDLDLASWLVDSRVSRVASFGSLKFFRLDHAPKGATKRCTDECPAEPTCPFSAPAFYLKRGNEWPVSVISVDPSPEARRKALETGPYGMCVFQNDNDVVDHQVVAAEFENGVSLDFAVRANTLHCFRTIRVVGTEGELNGHFEKSEFTVTRWSQGQALGLGQHGDPVVIPRIAGEHGGGDTGVIRNFLRCVREGDEEGIRRSLEIAVEGHLLAFAAEKARRDGRNIAMEDYRASVFSPAL